MSSEDCYQRSKTDLGTSKLSPDCSEEPDFYEGGMGLRSASPEARSERTSGELGTA